MILLGKIRSSTWVKINCALTVFITVLLLINYFHEEKRIVKGLEPHEINPCCGFPCQNGGVCISSENKYTCDCTETGYFGKHCDKATPTQFLNKLIKFNPTEACSNIVDYFPALWKILNSVGFLQTIFTKNLYMTTANWGSADFRWTTAFDLISIDSNRNSSFSARSLPPVPKMCPTPMGVRGPKELPPAHLIYDKILKRNKFEPCSKGTNLLYATYIQHFLSQFDSYEVEQQKEHEWGNNIIDMSHVYGKIESSRRALRFFKDGKLKSRVYKGEEYPAFVDDCDGVNMIYPQTHFKSFMSAMMQERQTTPRWALGNPGLSMTPMLFVMSTIWLREHNRICTLLGSEHKDWTDERLYHTAKAIVTGEAIKITLTEFMHHFMQSHMEILYKPELMSSLHLQFSATVPRELAFLPHWHSLISDQLVIESKVYNISQLMFTNNMVVFEHGIEQMIQSMATQPAGTISNSIDATFKCCISYIIDESRALRIQSFNNYRRRFGLEPAKNFEDLTGDFELATLLKEIYSDVEAVELVVGLLLEHNTGRGIAPSTITTISAAWLIRGLISHPINSPDWWKPSTFGGEIGMNIVKLSSIKKLICMNMKNKCLDIHVDFKVPDSAKLQI